MAFPYGGRPCDAHPSAGTTSGSPRSRARCASGLRRASDRTCACGARRSARTTISAGEGVCVCCVCVCLCVCACVCMCVRMAVLNGACVYAPALCGGATALAHWCTLRSNCGGTGTGSERALGARRGARVDALGARRGGAQRAGGQGAAVGAPGDFERCVCAGARRASVQATIAGPCKRGGAHACRVLSSDRRAIQHSAVNAPRHL